ncbi:hypothetical protein VOLCADRAFT_104931 [Volvox carteri f. nagariensis]|uniref:Uncharacterized protein n=1 Tax=Volvox carteri f. nagariensis TaxID=3068 RepID=D8TX66_VOLCA|nr:uncharacterized protein VOLCADRAFT_104931 [Volvox carteri f. nagariensis]EFJ47957.1 hypothetical protein VOLCADRAFT_104931 [Volvox carteri f. nagariensis]|eukprot:XP_002951063.1 hypothetical protein VOLCADRAFT_104931 [Volvox carteri f. nagariensis]
MGRRTQARDIRQYGMTDLTTTGPKESYVKTLRASYQFTNKKMETIQQQVTSKLNIVTARGAAHDDEYESNCLAEWPASRIIRLHTAGDSAAAGLHCLCAPKGQGGTGTQCQWEGSTISQVNTIHRLKALSPSTIRRVFDPNSSRSRSLRGHKYVLYQ